MYKIIGADQKEYGPITAEQMRQWIMEGRVNARTLVWSDTSNNWKPLAVYPEFSTSVPPLPSGAVPPPQVMPSTRPSNYLTPAILTTICCCPIFGIIAIVYAAQVNGKFDRGDYAGAEASAKKARMWVWISIISTIVVSALSVMMRSLGSLGGVQF
jgi:hypothetical protein